MDKTLETTQQWLLQMPQWLYATLIFCVWFLGTTTLKRLIFRRIRKFAEKTETIWDDILIASARRPLMLIIIGIGFGLICALTDLSEHVERSLMTAFRVFVVFAIVLFFDRLIREIGKRQGHRKEFSLITQGVFQGFVRAVVIGLGLLILADTMGISITPILASLGIGSLAVALGLQDTLTNFFAGIYVTIDQPIRKGDFIRLDSGEEGYVIEIGWRSTRIKLLPNNVVIVPNQKLTASTIMNYYLPDKEIAVLVQVGVHYESDLKKVEQVTIEVAKQIMKTVPGGVPSFEPFIRFHTFGESGINFSVILRGKEFVDQHIIKHEFIKALHERYRKEGIVVPFPLRTLDIPQKTLQALAANIKKI